LPDADDGEPRREEGLNQLPRGRVADDEAAEADDIEVVVLDALVRGKCFMDQARAGARHLIGGHTRPNAAAAHGHAPVHFAARDGASQRNNEIRVVILRLRTEISEIGHVMTGLAQSPDKMLLQLKAAVVRGDSDPLRFRLHHCAGVGHRSIRCSVRRVFAFGGF
jgi:hypothetical protein